MKHLKPYIILLTFLYFTCFVNITTIFAKSRQSIFTNTTNVRIENLKNSLQNNKSSYNTKIESISNNLESVFLYKVIDKVLPEAKDDAFFKNVNAGGLYRTLLIQEYSKLLSKKIDLGIKKELLSKQK